MQYNIYTYIDIIFRFFQWNSGHYYLIRRESLNMFFTWSTFMNGAWIIFPDIWKGKHLGTVWLFQCIIFEKMKLQSTKVWNRMLIKISLKKEPRNTQFWKTFLWCFQEVLSILLCFTLLFFLFLFFFFYFYNPAVFLILFVLSDTSVIFSLSNYT